MRTTLRRLLSTLGAVALVTTFFTASPGASAGAADTVAPVLRSISVPAGPYVPGQQITWTLDVVDSSPIKWIQLYYATPGAAPGYFMVEFEPQRDWRAGPLTWTIPGTPSSAPYNGQYEITSIWVHDEAGNSADYYADGRLRTQPATATTRALDIRSPLSIINSPRDVTPPVLEAFKAPTAVTIAQLIGIELTIREATQLSVAVFGRRDGGDEILLGERFRFPAQGGFTFFPKDVGVIDLTKVVLSDVNGNRATYLANGTFTTVPATSTTPRPHPFTIGRIKVLPTPAEIVSLTPRSGGAQLTWTQTPSAGQRITITPGNRVITGGPSSTGEQYRTVTLTGLQNGTTYSIKVTPTSPAGEGDTATGSVTPRMTMAVFGPGDRTGDRRADLWTTGFGDVTSDETWRLYTGAGGGAIGRTLHPVSAYGVEEGFPGSTTGRGPGASWGALTLVGSELQALTPTGSSVIGYGFNIFRTIDASSDLTGDGVADLIGITPAGDFYRYTSTSTGTIGRGVRLGGGWGAFQSVFSPGDFNGDKRADVVAVDVLGTLWLYPGTGRGGFAPRVQIGTGWNSFGSVLPLRDFNGDGAVDIGAITMDGKLLMYPGNGRGSFFSKVQIGTGWGAFL